MSTSIQYQIRHNPKTNQLQSFGMNMIMLPMQTIFQANTILNDSGMNIIKERLKDHVIQTGKSLYKEALKINSHLNSFQERLQLIQALWKANGLGLLELQNVSINGGSIKLMLDPLSDFIKNNPRYDTACIDFIIPFFQGMLFAALHLNSESSVITLVGITENTITMELQINQAIK